MDVMALLHPLLGSLPRLGRRLLIPQHQQQLGRSQGAPRYVALLKD